MAQGAPISVYGEVVTGWMLFGMHSKERQDNLKKDLLMFGTALISLLFCLNGCSDTNSSSNAHIGPQENNLPNYDKKITEIIGSEKIDKNAISILVEKSKYRLTLYNGKKPIKSYPVVFGYNAVDDKLKEGDGCTPEGKFKIRDLYPHRSWSKFLWLDYPTQDSWEQHRKAKSDGKINSDDTIGGEIGVHGVPSGADSLIDERSNWTIGCISMKNKDIDELYRIVKKGAKVEIVH